MSDAGATKRVPPAATTNECSFTSFSDLGAAIPSSFEGDEAGSAGGRGGDANASLLSLSGIKSLLHPKSHLEESSEQTPLLGREHRARRKQRGKRYVGGEDVFASYEDGGEGQGSENERGASLATCRQCEANDSPISPVKLIIISQILFATMSVLAEVLARDQQDRRMSELQILTIQGIALWIASFGTLLLTKTKYAFLGVPGLRSWIWGRAGCVAVSSLLFAIAAQKLPMMNLIVIAYLSPIIYNLLSNFFLSSPLPFRGHIVSVSLLLGLVLLIQPTVLFPDNEDYLTVPASPIDLPPIGDYDLDLPLSWAYTAAFTSAFFMILSLALLSRAVKISIYHSLASNSLLTALFSLGMYLWTQISHQQQHHQEIPGFIIPSTKHALLLLLIIITSFFAHLFQALAFQRKSPRQLSLVSFIQPIFSTGLQTIFLDRTIDVLPLAGSVLIAANIAWMTTPIASEEEDEEW